MASTEVIRTAGIILFRRIPPRNVIEYLLMQASKKHHWTPPKGHVDPGESDFETALRETKEETGFDEKAFRVIPDFMCELNYKKTIGGIKRPKVVTYWAAETIDPNSKVTMSSEHQDFKWLPLKEAIELSGFDKKIHRKTNKFLEDCEAKINSLGEQ